MGDWTQLAQDSNRVIITPASVDSIGVEIRGQGIAAPVVAAWPAANRAIYIPFTVGQPITVTNIAIFTGAASGNVDVGIYDQFGNRLVSKGTTAQAGASATQTFAITSTTLNPGVYYMAMAMDNAVGTIRRFAAGILQPLASCGILSQSTAFVLPATATFAPIQDPFIPSMILLARTVV